MDSSSPDNKKETRFKISKKDIDKTHDKIPISNNARNALGKRKRNRKAGGIIYIGHIPHGFYEDEMKSYFNQFGKVVATSVARSKKTGRSRGFGFVEFKDEEVAKIAAEVMNNYLMFNKILKCRYIPPEEKRGGIIESRVKSYDFPRQRNRRINEQQKEKAMSKLTQEAYLEKAQAKINQFKKFFEQRGVEFNFQLKSNGDTCSSVPKGSKTKTKSGADSKSDSKDDEDDEFGILEIDESENEISFTTPPKVKKVFKKSLNSNTTPKVKNTKKLEAAKQASKLKKSNLRKIQKNVKIKKKTNAASDSKKIVQKTKNKEKSLQAKEFLVRDITSVAKRRKGNTVCNVGASKKSGKNTTATEKPGRDNVLRNRRNRIQISIKAEN